MEKKTWQVLFFVLLSWPGVLTSPSVPDFNVDTTLESLNNEKKDLFEQFLEKVDSYLEADSLRADFNKGKPTVQMVLTKILPQHFFGTNTTDFRDAATELFSDEIELQYYLDDRMRSIGRKISKIWKAGNVGEIVGNIKEIGVELTETIEKLAQMVIETEEDYIKELKSLYNVATMIGPEVKETIKAIGRIENEAMKIRWALKTLGETTVRRCKKIVRALENLLNKTTPMEGDMKRLLRSTANLLEISHKKLGESITSYQNMKTELLGLVVDLKSHGKSLAKVTKDAEKEYNEKKDIGWIKVVVGGITTLLMGIASGLGLADGKLGASDIIGPGAFGVGVYSVAANSVGINTLIENHSSMSAELQTYRNDVQKYVRSSEDLQGILKLEEEAAREWHAIVTEIQADFGADLNMLTEAIEDKEYFDDLVDAKEIFGLLKKSAQNFLDILAEKKEKVNEIHNSFKGDLGLTL